MSEPRPEQRPITVLCIAGYEKGAELIRECHRQGCRVLLLTVESLADVDWPRDCIDQMLFMPNLETREHVINAVSYLARSQRIDRIIALDDYDVELAAAVREHLRVPGMGDTTARYFRDKLAMRVKAQEHGILVPEFVGILNHEDVAEYMRNVPAPWVLKPRFEASAIGIKKIRAAEELWPILDELGDRQSFHLLERFVPGDIYHVDSIISEREIVFADVHKYGAPPMAVMHEGGIFSTRTLERDAPEHAELLATNAELLGSLGLVRGVTHTEFIRGKADGKFYFLETAARVGGANIVEVVEAATGINLWHEWAKIEIGRGDVPYAVPVHRDDYAGVLISLAKQEWPDTSGYTDPEIVWRLAKRHHVGLIVASPEASRVKELLESYGNRFADEFMASLPAPDKPTS